MPSSEQRRKREQMENNPAPYDTLIVVGQNIQANITYTPEQFFQLKAAITSQMMTFGYVAAIIGFCIGIYVGWSWAKRKYGEKL